MADKSPSKIPTPVSSLRRSASLRVRGERPLIVYSTSPTPFPSIDEKEEVSNGISPQWEPTRFNLGLRSRSQASGLNRRDDDVESIESFGSNISGLSRASMRSNCEHSPFAKNGTTYSGRSNKYVVHCSGHCNGSEEYLTPTQRANRNIRRLKTLLQLAKEKLIEKEKEIFKLTKEVVELKVFKASIHDDDFSGSSSPSDCKDSPRTVDCNDCGTYTIDETRDFGTDTFADVTPIQTSRSFVDKLDCEAEKESPRGKLSPTSPLHGFQRDKMSATPEYLLSSLADSGHYDDLASSLSLQSKDSLNLHVLPEEKPAAPENRDREEERARLVKMYEAMLTDKRDSYENEMRMVKMVHEENNLRMIDDFEIKLKEEERKFEEKFNELLRNTELEKIEIVERLEKSLEDAKREQRDHLHKCHLLGKNDDLASNSYLELVEAEKATYETSLSDIKAKFEKERQKIEKSFDDAMAAERIKFENTVEEIQFENDRKVETLNKKITDFEAKYNDLLTKYHDSLAKISQLEECNKMLKTSLEEQEAKQKEMYLKMYMKGQEAVKFQQADEASCSSSAPVPELLVQLKVTEVELENLKDSEYRAQHKDEQGVCLLSAKEALSLWMLAARKAMYKRLSDTQRSQQPSTSSHPTGQDAEATLQFLKSAVYYFLTDRDNHLDHLRAIERILGFTQTERRDIATHYSY